MAGCTLFHLENSIYLSEEFGYRGSLFDRNLLVGIVFVFCMDKLQVFVTPQIGLQVLYF
jgi:hypothetical protein